MKGYFLIFFALTMPYGDALSQLAGDKIPGQSISMVSPLEVSGLSARGFTVSWETDMPGTSEIFWGRTPGCELGAIGGTGPPATAHALSVGGLLPSELFYVTAFSVRDDDTAFCGTRAIITSSLSSGDIRVFFTSHADHSVAAGAYAVQLDDLVDDTLISYIHRATLSLDIAIYNVGATGISSIASAINHAYYRGVRVRIIFNSSTANQGLWGLDPAIRRMASPSGPTYGIMHNKFMIIDALSDDPGDPVVWTGSTNWTSNNINTDANQVIIIQDQSLAIAYTLEFNEMWGSSGEVPDLSASRFGSRKTDNTPHEFMIGGKEVFLYFSPSDGVNQKITGAIASAMCDIAVNTMLITRDDIGFALRNRKEAGVKTRVIVNKEQDCSETVANTLKASLGQDFRSSGEYGVLHSKCMIVDHACADGKPFILAGSHNWSSNADEKNDENTLIIYDATIANIFYQEFMARFNNGLILATDEPETLPFMIFPNPSSGLVNLQFERPTRGPVRFSVFNRLGQLVFRYDETDISQIPVRLDMSHLMEGLYFIELTAEGYRQCEKLLIRR